MKLHSGNGTLCKMYLENSQCQNNLEKPWNKGAEVYLGRVVLRQIIDRLPRKSDNRPT